MSGGSTDKGEPNLTPILDMVFQLITFFMLVINFKSAEMDLSLKLPVVGSSRPVEGKNSGDTLLVLNIRYDTAHPKGYLVIYGTPKEDIEGYMASERASFKLSKEDVQEGGKEVPAVVVIRADRGTPFHTVNRVITACQENGFRRFALKARMYEDKKG